MLLFGKNPVWEALGSQRQINKVFIDEAKRDEDFFKRLRKLAKDRGVPVYYVDYNFFTQRFHQQVHQGVAASSAELTAYTVADLVAEKDRRPIILALDHLQDPQNFGSLIRSAAAFGVEGVVFPERRAVRITPTVEKIAAGALSYVKLAPITSLANALLNFHNEDFTVCGLDAKAQENVWDIDLAGPVVLVVGSEDAGLSRMVRERCNHLAKIPLPGKISSLNAAIAGALFLAEVTRQRQRR